ncbi:unnamed protein product [Clonostachys rosea f. rosea IK726]|uniref:Uncharacterized protein n=2 Tax=Bionectria ochroleuca TaxID=29856 RepID=A0A0B7K7U3_BIOOC|nr:unnamed protein product [Clonostachys rosea f. rosea IK726]
MLTIAQASGLIAGGVMIVQYSLPLALVIILVKVIGNETTAATWSSVNRAISNTIWPLVLQTDSIGARNRSTSVLALLWTITTGALLLVLAGVLTPLGLSELVGPDASATPVNFQYARDDSVWGRVTMDRPDARFGRYCEVGRRLNCPGQYHGVDFVEFPNGTLRSVKQNEDSIIDTRIPANFTTMFSSATDGVGDTISGLFDIQYRRWKTAYVDLVDNGEPRIQGAQRFVENLIPQDDISIREGLIIDTRNNPGLGLRNHTIPIGLRQGGTWSEDLTWFEPVTRCADTNLTIEIRINDTVDTFGSETKVYLVDHGAFRNLDLGELETRPWIDNQSLDLFGRAHKAARMFNVFTADILNISLPLGPGNDTLPEISVTTSLSQNATLWGDLTLFGGIKPENIQINEIKTIADLYRYKMSTQNISVPRNFTNRYPDGYKKLFASNFTAIEQICRGFWHIDNTDIDRRASNITNAAVSCGFLLGAGRSSLESEGGIMKQSMNGLLTYHRNMYICASAMKASIKSVDFLYNGTDGKLPNLKVTGISDKVYTNEQSKPLWAVEASAPERMTYDPLWGLVDDRYENTPGFSTMRSEQLWLPVGSGNAARGLGARDGWDSLAGIQAPIFELYNAYNTLANRDSYTEGNSYSLVERFVKLSVNDTLASNIPSLMITDALASTIVGTKTAIRNTPIAYPARLTVNDPLMGFPHAQVVASSRVIHYDLRYAIPGIITLILLFVVVVWALTIVAITRGGIVTTIREMDNQTSTGRLATALLSPERSNPGLSSEKWAETDGNLVLKFGHIGERKAEYFMAMLDRDAIPDYQPEPETPLSPYPGTPLSPLAKSKEEGSVRTKLVRVDSYEIR